MWLAVAALVYVLSVGPVVRLCVAGAFPAWVTRIYLPLAVLSDHSGGFREALDWYIYDLWKSDGTD